VSTAPQSNQNAGKDAKPCRWCQAWNAAFAASRLPECDVRPFQLASEKLRAAGLEMVARLARRDPGKCKGCQRSAEIHLGDVLGPDRRKWRAAMWRDNPSMRFMMRACPGETFQEDAK
jgi:hypothetical protein